ncbi:MAG: DUF4136 domain-containing protein [bacterium]|nr:DUF4136 domain-containing protein [bacterium]MDP7570772.1 DUF4136 domain-containing protein [Myxococcota bacterium]
MSHPLRFRPLFLASGLLTLVACATPMRIHFDRDPGTNFSAFRTFAWIGPAPLARAKQGSKTNSAVSPLDDRRIRDAVNRILETRGYQLVDSPAKADMVVAYSVGSEDKVRVHETPGMMPTYPYPARYRYGPWYTGSNVSVQQYTQGTLTLEFYDRKSEQAIWVGWASKRLSPRDDSQELIAEAVTKILANFPTKPRT